MDGSQPCFSKEMKILEPAEAHGRRFQAFLEPPEQGIWGHPLRAAIWQPEVELLFVYFQYNKI